MKRFWGWLCAPCNRPLGILLLLGSLLGAGFFTSSFAFVEYSNTAQFCSSCHVMSTAFDEYRTTVHHTNAAGVKAICSDCHVPKGWGHKLMRKVQATAELYHFIAGTIDTPEKYEAKRLELARRVWKRMADSDSRGCRNCHDFSDMKIDAQSTKASQMHAKAMRNGHTCIDCHKGIAHRYPDTKSHLQTAWATLQDEAKGATSDAKRIYPIGTQRLYAEAGGAGDALAVVLAAAELDVEETHDDWLKVQVTGWIRNGERKVVYASRGQSIVVASVGKKAQDRLKSLDVVSTEVRGVPTSAQPGGEAADKGQAGADTWSKVAFSAWMKSGEAVGSREPIWRYAAELNELTCGKCHVPYKPDAFGVEDWPGHMKDMKPYADLDKEPSRLLSSYLQYNARDAASR